MITDRVVSRLEIEIPAREGLRLMGVTPRKRAPRASVMRCFEEEMAAAQSLIEPRAVHATCAEGLPGSQSVPAGVPHALAVCTIGTRLEERARRLIEEGDAARAMILDAIGSAAVEEVADRVNGELCDRHLAAGRQPGLRRSPGYGKWPVSEQPLIFAVLQPLETGVELNDSCVMTPGKSISFVMPLDGGEHVRGPRGRCARCGMRDCEYRVAPGAPGGPGEPGEGVG